MLERSAVYCKLIVPGMIERNKDIIVNISSIAGIEVYPTGNVYCASKHAVNAITKGLRIDLVKHGIRVGSISRNTSKRVFSVRYHGDKEGKSRLQRTPTRLQPRILQMHWSLSLHARLM